MRSDVSAQSIGIGLLVVIVGYASTVAVVIHGLSAVGASEGQIVSGLAVLCLAMGLGGVALSLATRMPISVAWSTPGMALLATLGTLPGGFPAAVGAFIATGVLIMLTGLWTPLGRLVAMIPRPVANGMLGGILLKLCLAPFVALTEAPGVALVVIAVWVVVGRFWRLWAAPAALVVALGALALTSPGGISYAVAPHVEWVTPVFDWQAMMSIALPLFVVTMASQNIPGLTVLSTFGYRPATRPIFLLTGAASVAGAFWGSPTVNLAAITAALCAGPDAHPDHARRYVAAAVAGFAYVGFAALAGVTTVLVTHASPILVEAVAGLALTGAFGSAMLATVQEEKERVPALMTFLVTASGYSIFGIGSAFWGLIGGVAVHLVTTAGSRKA
ncbi:benzoate/H(+) symporter BenE family transporter [Labrys wisconsinensis]|uniref:Benzoate membrane transport protein n=1 Tax=Labrys wisconsinensis TaxID=425677 RepID=A0ABU0JAX9_9HYPH|nr:benzoate/H(+) symporter BenE family transporter [Labrys wisconsinensis]MDQ0471425.1 benzoate membrane transport protein [Labrys wisconsinensis]